MTIGQTTFLTQLVNVGFYVTPNGEFQVYIGI